MMQRHPVPFAALAVGSGGLVGGAVTRLLGFGWFLGGFLIGMGVVYAALAAAYAMMTD
jgi:hypothetical protein